MNLKKKIKFLNIIKVIIIPNNDDIYEYKKLLWFNANDYMQFSNNLNTEIKFLMKIYPNITTKDARKILCQSDNLLINSSNNLPNNLLINSSNNLPNNLLINSSNNLPNKNKLLDRNQNKLFNKNYNVLNKNKLSINILIIITFYILIFVIILFFYKYRLN